MRNPLSLIEQGLAALLGSVTHDRKQGVCTKDCWCQIAARVVAYTQSLDEGTPVSTSITGKSKSTLEVEAWEAREHVIAASASLVAARIYSDLHPSDPSGGADIELRDDILDEAITEAHIRKVLWDVTA